MPQPLDLDVEHELISLRNRVSQLEEDLYSHVKNQTVGPGTQEGHRDPSVVTEILQIQQLLLNNTFEGDNALQEQVVWKPDGNGPIANSMFVERLDTYRHQYFHIDLVLAANVGTTYSDLFTGLYTGYTFIGGLIFAAGFRMDTAALIGSITTGSADGTTRTFAGAGTGGIYFNSGGLSVSAHASYETHIIGILVALWDKD